jgi:hypothetical protein
LAAAAVVAALACTAPARAAGDTPPADAEASAATALFRQAREDAKRGDWADACPRFAESLRLAPSSGTMLNLADCEEHLGRLSDALAHYQRALEGLPPSDDRIAFARARIGKLSPRVPRVRLRPRGEIAGVDLDGVKLGPVAFGVLLPVNPGKHVAVVHAAGRADRSVAFEIAEGMSQDVELAPGDASNEPDARPPPPARPLDPVPPPTASASSPAPSSLKKLAWPAFGVAAAGIALGAVTGIFALDRASAVRSRCPDRTCTSSADVDYASTGSTYATVSTIGFVVGAAFAAVGVACLVWGGPSQPARTAMW